MRDIPYGRQQIVEQDVEAVTEVLRSKFLTQGPAVPAFEASVATYCGVAHGVAMNSATSALHVACMALGLGENDLLWTVPNTFVASANCARYCGAQVDFVDIDPETYVMSPAALEDRLKAARKAGRLPKIVVPVHFAGQSCDMAAIHALAKAYGFAVVEDASHAIGARHDGKPVGDCRYSDITIFSFHPVKIITTAEGGMAMTGSAALADKMRLLRSHGITRAAALMQEPAHGPWYYEQLSLGLNYRMTDVHAALGVSQMQRLDQCVAQRHDIARTYDAALSGSGVVLPHQAKHSYSAFHLYPVLLADAAQRLAVFNGMRAAGIGVNVHYIPVHLQPYYRAFGFKAGDFPVAENYYNRTMSLPMFSGLSAEDQAFVIATLKSLVAG